MAIKKPQDVEFDETKLKWDQARINWRQKQYTLAQKRLDSEVLRHCAPRLPFDRGILHDSGILHTILGSGLVRWETPYARKLYYNPEYDFNGAPMRGAYWFERMKADVGNYLLKMAMREASK